MKIGFQSTVENTLEVSVSNKVIATVFGPAACGKDTLINNLTTQYPDHYSRIINNTTRPPRPYEKYGIDYYFIDLEQHETLIKHDKYFTYVKANGRSYGVLKSEIEDSWATQKVPLGHFGVEDHYKLWKKEDLGEFAVNSVAIVTKNFSVWEQRMNLRLMEKIINEEEVARRAKSAVSELLFMKNNESMFAFIVNDRVDIALNSMHLYFTRGIKPHYHSIHTDNLIEDFDMYINKLGRI